MLSRAMRLLSSKLYSSRLMSHSRLNSSLKNGRGLKGTGDSCCASMISWMAEVTTSKISSLLDSISVLRKIMTNLQAESRKE